MTEKEGLLQRIEKLRSSNGVGMFEMTDEEENSFRWGHARAIVDVRTKLNKTIAEGKEIREREKEEITPGEWIIPIEAFDMFLNLLDSKRRSGE